MIITNENIVFSREWDYSGWRELTDEHTVSVQMDWNQTLVTLINECSIFLLRIKDCGHGDTIHLNEAMLPLFNTLFYYSPDKKVLGNRYKIVIDNQVRPDGIYIFDKKNPSQIAYIKIEGMKLSKKKAFITGITGQDGSYLAELLLEKGYEVHGVMRRSSSFNTGRIDHIFEHPNLHLHYGDITDAMSITNLIAQIKPDELYNLAAQSHVKVSFEQPYYTGMVDALGTLTILEAMRVHCPTSKFYQASTSELYGGMSYNMPEKGYTEESVFHPRSPYGVAKIYGFWAVKNYREAYKLFACNGILFNHESPRRGGTFVTKKVISSLVEISNGKEDTLKLGNLDSKRDWGYAKEYVEGMWLMLQRETPEDFVLATSETHTVRELVEVTCGQLGYNLEWKGSGLEEKGYDKKTGKLLVEIDEKYFRPSEVELLLGDASKARVELGWEPKVKFKELVKIMVEAEMPVHV